jgi:L-ascorbate metabolism protein UlaG (beta-lactamase superfamily)
MASTCYSTLLFRAMSWPSILTWKPSQPTTFSCPMAILTTCWMWLPSPTALVLGGWELYTYFQKQGVQHVRPINPGGQYAFDFGTVKAVIAQHSSSLPDGSYGGVASGFVLQTAEGNFYYSGDTALTLDMTLIPKWAALDFAVLPIGDGLTMGVSGAIEAAAFVQVKHVIGVHYDTFGFIKIDKADAAQRFEKAGLTLHLPTIGDTISL